MADERYEGKPFLRLVECYVRHIVGGLSSHDADLLKQTTPKLQSTFKRDGEWHEIVAAVMDFDGGFDGSVRAQWEKARAAGLTAEDFSPGCRQGDRGVN